MIYQPFTFPTKSRNFTCASGSQSSASCRVQYSVRGHTWPHTSGSPHRLPMSTYMRNTWALISCCDWSAWGSLLLNRLLIKFKQIRCAGFTISGFPKSESAARHDPRYGSGLFVVTLALHLAVLHYLLYNFSQRNKLVRRKAAPSFCTVESGGLDEYA